MKTDIADRWIAALRSGKYKQTRRQLRETKASANEFSFCCLGVLCDLHSKETGTQWDDEANEYLGADLGLPEEVMVWAGTPNEGVLATPVAGAKHLASLNDINMFTFAQIADVIEAQKETL